MKNLTNALSTGVLKIMAKMGVSTIMSYRGAQLFEAIGLNKDVINEYFTGTTSRVGGVGLDELAEEGAIRHRVAYPSQWTARPHRNLRTGGDYKWRRTGSTILRPSSCCSNPPSVAITTCSRSIRRTSTTPPTV